jgi:hypothetical protein
MWNHEGWTVEASGLTGWENVPVVYGGPPPNPTFGDLADEVLRQMEWARRECVTSVDSFQAGNSWLDYDQTMTLAPPGWQP